MKKTKRTYTNEFKLEAIRLSETSGKSDSQIERDLGISKGCLYRWKKRSRGMASTRSLVADDSLLSKSISANWSVRTRSCAKSEIS